LFATFSGVLEPFNGEPHLSIGRFSTRESLGLVDPLVLAMTSSGFGF
jgi:hypothetical protein